MSNISQLTSRKRMNKAFPFLLLISLLSCKKEGAIIRDNVSIELSTYQDKGKTKASAMPVLDPKSQLQACERRFDYLLLNIPEIHQPGKAAERDAINTLYPDTLTIKQRYLDIYAQDKMLVSYFEETAAPLRQPGMQRNRIYSPDELMEVASRYFYCDQVNPDTSVQMHVCIGINGMKESHWKKDYTLLAAFCYEAIFNDLDKDNSSIESAYVAEKHAACQKYRPNIVSLDKYLEDVKQDLFSRMQNNAVLKEQLLAYYEVNKGNLAFEIRLKK